MHPSSVEIENEFSEIAEEVTRLNNRLTRLDRETLLPDSQEEWEACQVCASAAEKIYSGCERVMARLADEIDDARVVHSAGWHAALLRRVAHPFPGTRGAIISRECHAVLDRIRSFRHRERNSYAINLDFPVVVERAREAVIGFDMFRQQVRAFLEEDRSQNPVA